MSLPESTERSLMRIGALLALFIGVLLIFTYLKPLAVALLIAATLAYLCNPLVEQLMKRARISRSQAVRLVFWGMLLIGGALLGLLSWSVSWIVPHYLDELKQALAALQAWVLATMENLGWRVDLSLILTSFGRLIGELVAMAPSQGLNFLISIPTNLLWGLIILAGFYSLLRDAPQLFDWLLDLVPRTYVHHLRQLAQELDRIWGIFLRVQILMFFLLGFLFLLGAFLVILLFRSGLVRFSWIGFILLLVLVYVLVQQLDNLWLRPQLMGHHLRLHPGLVFAALTASLVLGGVLAAFLVVPLLASAKVLGRYVYCMLLDEDPYPMHSDEPSAG